MSARRSSPSPTTARRFRDLDLAGAGLRWAQRRRARAAIPRPTARASPSAAMSSRASASFGADGPAWRRLALWMRAMGRAGRGAAGAAAGARAGAGGSAPATWRGWPGRAGSTAGVQPRHFRTEAARRVIPGLALHVDLGPDDFAGAGLGLVLALLASSAGFRVPVGGARRSPRRCCAGCTEAGGELRLNAHVERIVVRGRARRRGAHARRRDRRRARPSWPTSGRRRCTAGCCADVPGSCWCARGCGGSATAGARSRWTGRCPGRCRGRPPRRASRPWSTPATASPTCGGSRGRCGPGDLPDNPVSRHRPAVAVRPEPRPGGRPHALGVLAGARRRRGRLGEPQRERSPTGSSGASRGWRRGSAS